MKQTRWMQILEEKYNAGISNMFLISGNIGDYAVPGNFLNDYLIKYLIDVMKLKRVVTFNYSSGSTFYPESQGSVKTQEQIAMGTEGDWKQMLEDLKYANEPTAYIVEYPEFLIPKATNGYVEDMTKKRLIDLHRTMNSEAFLTSNHMLILVTEAQSDIHDMFMSANSRTVPISIEFPNTEERAEMIRYLKGTSQREVKWELSEEQFAKLTAGLSRVHLEDLYLLSETKGVLEKAMVMQRKEELIKKEFGEVIEIFDTEGYSLDHFAGQEHIKEYHREAVIQPFVEGDTDFVPKGLLYMGPPGTGKTFFAGCIAGEAGINFVEFKMSKILDKYVGEAERNLEKAFNCFKSLAPVGVFIDEIDQALSRGGNDSNSVMKNIFGMFLSFMSDPENRGKILWIGATNYPNKLDEALKRAGRFDKKIPFLPPTKDERIEVFKYHFKKRNFPCEIQNYEFLGRQTEGYTPAEIENIVVKTLELAKRKKKTVIDDALVNHAMECIISSQNVRIQEMTNIALDECNDLEFLPEKYREEAKKRAGMLK